MLVIACLPLVVACLIVRRVLNNYVWGDFDTFENMTANAAFRYCQLERGILI